MKKLTMLLSLLCLTAALAVPASALEYDIAAPGDPEYGKPTSVEPVATADRGELSNVDVLYAGRWCRYQWQRRHHRRST